VIGQLGYTNPETSNFVALSTPTEDLSLSSSHMRLGKIPNKFNSCILPWSDLVCRITRFCGSEIWYVSPKKCIFTPKRVLSSIFPCCFTYKICSTFNAFKRSPSSSMEGYMHQNCSNIAASLHFPSTRSQATLCGLSSLQAEVHWLLS
jgi:hypothetical protein